MAGAHHLTKGSIILLRVLKELSSHIEICFPLFWSNRIYSLFLTWILFKYLKIGIIAPGGFFFSLQAECFQVLPAYSFCDLVYRCFFWPCLPLAMVCALPTKNPRCSSSGRTNTFGGVEISLPTFWTSGIYWCIQVALIFLITFIILYWGCSQLHSPHAMLLHLIFKY